VKMKNVCFIKDGRPKRRDINRRSSQAHPSAAVRATSVLSVLTCASLCKD